MNKVSLIAIFLFFSSQPYCLMAQFPFFGESMRPKGKIKSFRESCYETSSKVPVLVQKSIFKYDEGLLTEQIIYNTVDSDKVDYNIKYRYEEGLRVEELADGEFKIIHFYDSKHNRIATKYSSDSLTYVDRFEYDLNNFKLVRFHYNKASELLYQDNYRYDKDQRLLERTYTDTEYPMKNRTFLYTNSAAGYVEQERCYASNGFMLYAKKYTYNLKMHISMEQVFNENGQPLSGKHYQHEYDAKENWVKLESKFPDGSFVTIRQIEYMK